MDQPDGKVNGMVREGFVRIVYGNGEVRYQCGSCGVVAVKNGHVADGRQRWVCKVCGRHFLEDSKFTRLAAKDREVIRLLVRDGCRPRVIARAYGISPETVQKIGRQE